MDVWFCGHQLLYTSGSAVDSKLDDSVPEGSHEEDGGVLPFADGNVLPSHVLTRRA